MTIEKVKGATSFSSSSSKVTRSGAFCAALAAIASQQSTVNAFELLPFLKLGEGLTREKVLPAPNNDYTMFDYGSDIQWTVSFRGLFDEDTGDEEIEITHKLVANILETDKI